MLPRPPRYHRVHGVDVPHRPAGAPRHVPGPDALSPFALDGFLRVEQVLDRESLELARRAVEWAVKDYMHGGRDPARVNFFELEYISLRRSVEFPQSCVRSTRRRTRCLQAQA